MGNKREASRANSVLNTAGRLMGEETDIKHLIFLSFSSNHRIQPQNYLKINLELMVEHISDINILE
jgi:hypothetical protein